MEKHLDKYIKEKHTQEECVGFIDGWKAAMDSLKPNQVEEFKHMGKKFKLHESENDDTIFTIESIEGDNKGAMIRWDEEDKGRLAQSYSFKLINMLIDEGSWILID